MNTPVNGGLFSFGDAIPFTVTVTDPEDGTIACSRVKVSFILGHDSHGHPMTSANGCSGTLQTTTDGEHDSAANIYGVIDAEYTDNGGLTTHTQAQLQPRLRQAEHYSSQNGVQAVAGAAPHGGGGGRLHRQQRLDRVHPVQPEPGRPRSRRGSAPSPGATRWRCGPARPPGTLVATVTVPATGGYATFQDVTVPISNPPTGTGQLYLVFKGATGGGLFDLDDFTFGTGSGPSRPRATWR